jgi:co-chaperonin GroES (HSP10)
MDTSQFIVVGDRLLIKPKSSDQRTASGLYLPPGLKEKEKIQSGYIMKAGPGYAIPSQIEEEPWKEESQSVRYIPLQANEGDLAIYLQSAAHEIEFNEQKFVIVPQSAILLLIRDEGLFD